jgi:YVTN family beta-propeller protein
VSASWHVPALCLALGCAGETVVYDTPDGAPWREGRAQWSAPDAGAPVAFVTNSRGNSVSVLDLNARRVLTTVPVPVVPLAENGPHHLAVDVARGVIYTPLSMPAPVNVPGPHGDHGNAFVNGVFVKRDLRTLRLLGQVEVDPNPGDMVLSHDRRRAYVSHFDMARALANVGDRPSQLSNVIEIDVERMVTLRRIPTCVAAHGMALSADDRTLYLACTGDDALGVIDLSRRPAAHGAPRAAHRGVHRPERHPSPFYALLPRDLARRAPRCGWGSARTPTACSSPSTPPAGPSTSSRLTRRSSRAIRGSRASAPTGRRWWCPRRTATARW